MESRLNRRSGAIVTAMLMATLLGLQLAAYRPGVMVWDSIYQYERVLSGRYDDWHPPAFEWLWRHLLWAARGPAPMIAVQLLLYWSGIGLLAGWALRQRRGRLAVALAATAALPISFALMMVVVKDALFAGSLVFATGLLAWRRLGAPGWTAALGLAVLLGAATLRFNALPGILPIAVALLPRRWRGTPRRLAVACAIVAVPVAAAVPLVNRLLDTERSVVELSLLIYDLGGITADSRTNVFPPMGIDDPVADNDHCYSTVSWDNYAWWAGDPCDIGFEAVRKAAQADRTSLYDDWARAVLHHPLAYAEHRLLHFNSNIRLAPPEEQNLPAFAQSDPNSWGFRLPERPLRTAIQDVVLWANDTPIGWPAFWMAVAGGVLVLAPLLRSRALLVPLALSSLLYALGYLPVSVASEMRYHLWTMIAALVAATIAGADLAAGDRAGRGRLLLALLPPLAVSAIGLAWRA